MIINLPLAKFHLSHLSWFYPNRLVKRDSGSKMRQQAAENMSLDLPFVVDILVAKETMII